jgi:hypothetical protein
MKAKEESNIRYDDVGAYYGDYASLKFRTASCQAGNHHACGSARIDHENLLFIVCNCHCHKKHNSRGDDNIQRKEIEEKEYQVNDDDD